MTRPVREDKPIPAKKNKKRWCKGKVGVEHRLKCYTYPELKGSNRGRNQPYRDGWYILACTVCGKEMDHYFPWPESWGLCQKEPKPGWVVE